MKRRGRGKEDSWSIHIYVEWEKARNSKEGEEIGASRKRLHSFSVLGEIM